MQGAFAPTYPLALTAMLASRPPVLAGPLHPRPMAAIRLSRRCAARAGLALRGVAASAAAAATAEPAAQSLGSQLPRVVLKGGKSKLFTSQQSPMVYSGAVDRVVGRPTPGAGDAVMLCDGADAVIAWGWYNPDSMFRVRVMQTTDEAGFSTSPDPAALLEERLAAAVGLRAALGLPSDATTAYRLCNSEGDRLSGLVVDRLGDRLVVGSSAAWVELRKEAICEALRRLTGVNTLTWRPSADMLAEEGLPADAEEPAATQEEGTSGSGEEVVVLEGGIKYLVDPLGQKTGFYCDQREHRAFIRSVAAGKDVLDLCCYTGGFALSAVAGGAASALGVDSSAAALALAARNAELNGFNAAFERADVAPWMSAAAAEGRQWDLVVLDPPKLAPNRKALTRALRKYESLNTAAMRLVRPGGLLMTCSCSGAVRAAHGDEGFDHMLKGAARRARRRATVVREGGAAPDHTADPGYPEGKYLTNVLLRIA